MKLIKIGISFIILIVLSNVSTVSWAQMDTSVTHNQNVQAVHIDRNFNLKYQQNLWKIKRAYPLALEAKKIIDDFEKELAEIESKRKQNKYAKEVNKELKADFTYILKDLYVEEGAMLMKLIHRETGMTVYDIISTYKSKTQAALSQATFKLYGHDTKCKYDPDNEDWITEVVIQDIESGKIKFDKTVKEVDKDLYRANMKEYNDNKKQTHKENRQRKKTTKKEMKKQKKASQ